MRVIVVGGGIVGAAVSFRMAQAGAEVILLEADRLGSGTSSVSFAWLNANGKPPAPYHALNASGVAEYHRLREELGSAPWLHLSGNVAWDTSIDGPEKLRSKVHMLRGWGYQVDLLPIQELRYLEPDLTAPPDIEEFAFYPTEGYLDTVACIGALTSAARVRGAIIREQVRVTGMVLNRGSITGVETNTGERLQADLVISCAGHATANVLAMVGVPFPMAPTVGLIAMSAPVAVGLRSIHVSNTLNIRPDGAGRIMMRHYDFDALANADTPVDPIPSFLDPLLERVANVLPATAGMRIESVRIGVRPIPADGLSAIGIVIPGLYVIVSHSAVTLGALFARLATQEILAGREDARLVDFRPDRLLRQDALA